MDTPRADTAGGGAHPRRREQPEGAVGATGPFEAPSACGKDIGPNPSRIAGASESLTFPGYQRRPAMRPFRGGGAFEKWLITSHHIHLEGGLRPRLPQPNPAATAGGQADAPAAELSAASVKSFALPMWTRGARGPVRGSTSQEHHTSATAMGAAAGGPGLEKEAREVGGECQGGGKVNFNSHVWVCR